MVLSYFLYNSVFSVNSVANYY